MGIVYLATMLANSETLNVITVVWKLFDISVWFTVLFLLYDDMCIAFRM